MKVRYWLGTVWYLLAASWFVASAATAYAWRRVRHRHLFPQE